MSLEHPVKTLNAEVARKIAAGEVIDRPNAIIRELMDNSIDAGATSVTVEISGGGIEKIRIVDNGCGLTKEDLSNCARPHATSKISTETDLLNLSTLGFRGEALASIAAVSRLSVISGGFKMRASITEDHIIESVAQTKGTIVQSEGLFENFPARRQFLKRAATEALMCKNTFIEKAMARPDITFRFIQDGEVKLDLPGGQTLKQRFVAASSYSEPEELFYEINGSDGKSEPDWKFSVVIGEPSVSRSNKKEIVIYVNGRRIQEYSLVQAVEYGGQGFFPNGTYPVAAVFAQVKADLVDFNIHPAKKEARFYDISGLHHGISSTIRNFFKQYTYSNFKNDKTADENSVADAWLSADGQKNENETQTDTDSEPEISEIAPSAPQEPVQNENLRARIPSYEKHISYKFNETGEKDFSDFRSRYLKGTSEKSQISYSKSENLRTENSKSRFFSKNTANIAEQALSLAGGQQSEKPRYIGSCLGTFLLAEKNNCLYLIDQHAVHERIIFNSLMKNQGNRQALLIPYKIKTDSKTQDNQLEKLKDELTKIGFETVKISDGEWEVRTIPERWTGSQYDLLSLLFVKQQEPSEIIRAIAAMTACKAAVKDGYVLDSSAATSLVEKAFTLDDPHCPHGRPIYTVISKAKLFELVKRT